MLFFKNLIKFRLWGQKKVQFVHTFFLFWNTFGFRLISFFSSSLRYKQNCILNQNCFSSKIFYKKQQKNPSVSAFFWIFLQQGPTFSRFPTLYSLNVQKTILSSPARPFFIQLFPNHIPSSPLFPYSGIRV